MILADMKPRTLQWNGLNELNLNRLLVQKLLGIIYTHDCSIRGFVFINQDSQSRKSIQETLYKRLSILARNELVSTQQGI